VRCGGVRCGFRIGGYGSGSDDAVHIHRVKIEGLHQNTRVASRNDRFVQYDACRAGRRSGIRRLRSAASLNQVTEERGAGAQNGPVTRNLQPREKPIV